MRANYDKHKDVVQTWTDQKYFLLQFDIEQYLEENKIFQEENKIFQHSTTDNVDYMHKHVPDLLCTLF